MRESEVLEKKSWAREIYLFFEDIFRVFYNFGTLVRGVYYFSRAFLRNQFSVFGLIIGALILPRYLSDYQCYQVTQAMVLTLVVYGLSVLVGKAGQVSLGHAAFVCIGAFVSARAMIGIGDTHLHFVPAILIAGIVSGSFGMAFGFPCLRLEGPYLALASNGLSIAAPLLIKSKYLEKYTNGADGLTIAQPDPPAWFEWLSLEKWQFYLVFAIVTPILIVCYHLLNGPFGRALIALRDNENGAQASGVNVSRYKIYAFTLSAFLAGISGGLFVLITGSAKYQNFGPIESVNYLMSAVLGGLGTLDGAIIGGLLLAYENQLSEYLANALPGAQHLGMAAVGIVVIAFLSFSKNLEGGIAQGLRKIDRELRIR